MTLVKSPANMAFVIGRVYSEGTPSDLVRAKVVGYTDNIGSPENLEFSQRRANTVMAQLIRKGVSVSFTEE
jgi:outer membrane protein OmpA-like peptidoglycan-associated protein